MVGGHRFQRMGLIKNNRLVVRQDAGSLTPQSQIAEEESVIDDQDLSVVHSATRTVVETFVMLRTAAAEAVVAVAGHFIPHSSTRTKGHVAQRPIGRRGRPLIDPSQFLQLIVPSKQAVGPLVGQLQTPQADVVATPFDQHGGEFSRDHGVEQGQILADQLFLQTDRVRRDHHAQWPAHRRHVGSVAARMAGTR